MLNITCERKLSLNTYFYLITNQFISIQPMKTKYNWCHAKSRKLDLKNIKDYLSPIGKGDQSLFLSKTL